MPTLRIYLELLARPIGWAAAAALFAVTYVVYSFLPGLLTQIGVGYYMFVATALGVVLYALFIFPVARILLRDKLTLGPPRWLMWSGVSIVERLVVGFLVSFATAVAIGFVAEQPSGEFFSLLQDGAEAVINPLFLGIFVWKIGLVCGVSSADFLSVNRFVWQERRAMVGFYLLVGLGLTAAGAGLSSMISDPTNTMSGVMLPAFAAFSSWLVGLFMIAMFQDYFESHQVPVDVFE